MKAKQLKLLQFIRNRSVHLGQGPTFKEMREHMGVTSNQTIADWLNILEQDGLIRQVKGKFRGIMITPNGMVSLLPENKPEDPLQKATSGYCGASTSAGFEPGVYVFSTLSPSISNLATIEGGEKSGGGT
jgi:SOS-response transcriptional repressor LexA